MLQGVDFFLIQKLFDVFHPQSPQKELFFQAFFDCMNSLSGGRDTVNLLRIILTKEVKQIDFDWVHNGNFAGLFCSSFVEDLFETYADTVSKPYLALIFSVVRTEIELSVPPSATPKVQTPLFLLPRHTKFFGCLSRLLSSFLLPLVANCVLGRCCIATCHF